MKIVIAVLCLIFAQMLVSTAIGENPSKYLSTTGNQVILM